MKTEERASASDTGVSTKDPDEMSNKELFTEISELTRLWQDMWARRAAVEAELSKREGNQ